MLEAIDRPFAVEIAWPSDAAMLVAPTYASYA